MANFSGQMVLICVTKSEIDDVVSMSMCQNMPCDWTEKSRYTNVVGDLVLGNLKLHTY